METTNPGTLHPFQILFDTLLGDVPVHPMPPDLRLGIIGNIVEDMMEAVSARQRQ